MNVPASIRSHPIHPMLIVFPIGLWIFSLMCDIVYHAGSHNVFWREMAFYTMLAGVTGAVLAAIPGFIDYLSLRNRENRRIATTHMALNLVVVASFIFNLALRISAPANAELFGLMLSIFAVTVMGASAWLGGSLVYVHHVAVGPVESSREERRAA